MEIFTPPIMDCAAVKEFAPSTAAVPVMPAGGISVRLVPARLAKYVDDIAGIFPAADIIATFPVPAVMPPATVNAVAPVLVITAVATFRPYVAARSLLVNVPVLYGDSVPVTVRLVIVTFDGKERAMLPPSAPCVTVI